MNATRSDGRPASTIHTPDHMIEALLSGVRDWLLDHDLTMARNHRLVIRQDGNYGDVAVLSECLDHPECTWQDAPSTVVVKVYR